MSEESDVRVVTVVDAAGRTVERAFTTPDAAAGYVRDRISGHAATSHRYRVLLARVDALVVDGGRIGNLPDGVSLSVRTSTPSDLVLAVPGLRHPKPSYEFSVDEAVAYFNAAQEALSESAPAAAAMLPDADQSATRGGDHV